MIPLSIARIISCDLCCLSAHSPIFFQLIWIQFHCSNPSVFCMMNRFYLPVIISFWNKYISRKWAQKAIFVTLGFILHTICLLLLTSKQISPSFSLWCFFFCLPLTAQCCWFAPFFFAWLSQLHLFLLLQEQPIYPALHLGHSCAFSIRQNMLVLALHIPGVAYLSYIPLGTCTASSVSQLLFESIRRPGVGRGDEQCLPLAALPANSGRKPWQSDMNVFLTQTQN